MSDLGFDLGPPAVTAIGVYPGTFNPPTRAHLAIAKAAVETHQLVRVDLAVSRDPLGKQGIQRPLFEHRVEILESLVDSHEWLGLVITDSRLVVDIAGGYDLVVMGADKWDQVNDVIWYEGEAERDQALSRLPTVAVAPRPPFPTPAELELAVPDEIAEVSSTALETESGHGWRARRQTSMRQQGRGLTPTATNPGWLVAE